MLLARIHKRISMLNQEAGAPRHTTLKRGDMKPGRNFKQSLVLLPVTNKDEVFPVVMGLQ
jgi:hypothetical protein